LPYSFTFQLLIQSAFIEDWPRFAHRGVLLDTSRHFLPVSVIKTNLELMAQNKFNVFHWHIVDDQSFPYRSELFPNLADKGAFSRRHVYSLDEIRALVEFAAVRGIRVLPEFDTPGHTLSWGNAVAGLLTECFDSSSKPIGTFGPIDPTNPVNYDFLLALVSEIRSVFPEEFFHLGGDEVSFDCWRSNPSVIEFMKQVGYGTDYSRLQNYYFQRLLDVIKAAGLYDNFLVWQEVFDNNNTLSSDIFVHVWKGYSNLEWGRTLQSVTAKGLPAILSSCWYLNYIRYGVDWQAFYDCDPHSFKGTDEQKKLVLGGEACMWGEYVDKTNVIPLLWPRASAVAERLWSSADVRDTTLAASRLDEHRCRMLR
uniref:Beta-hexosaminidase A n=1 Tax=Soboliphyme baturini TaxID=241478 RepID=A0A183IPN3_9BILA